MLGCGRDLRWVFEVFESVCEYAERRQQMGVIKSNGGNVVIEKLQQKAIELNGASNLVKTSRFTLRGLC